MFEENSQPMNINKKTERRCCSRWKYTWIKTIQYILRTQLTKDTWTSFYIRRDYKPKEDSENITITSKDNSILFTITL